MNHRLGIGNWCIVWAMTCLMVAQTTVSLAQEVTDSAETGSVETGPEDSGGSDPGESAVTAEAADAQPGPLEVVTPAGERIVYVPFKDLDETFQNPDANVILPYAEYQALYNAWRAKTLPPKPAEAVISAAHYRVRVDGDIARIAATLKIRVLGESWVRLPVTFGDAAVGKVTGDDVLLRGIGAGQYEFVFETGGQKTVEIELAKTIQQSPDGRQFKLQTPPVAITTLDVQVPRKDQAIEVTPMIVETTSPVPDEDITALSANIGATDSITVHWHPQASLKPEMNLLSSVTNHTVVSLEDSLIHTDTWLNYEILRGSMEQSRVVVPAHHRILDVTATARIKSWEAIEQDGNQIVVIEFFTAVDKPVTVEIHTERKLTDGQFQVAGWSAGEAARGIHALDVVRENGQVAVRHSADFHVTIAEQQGIVRIEAGEVAERLQGNNAQTYKFYSPAFTLQLNARPVEPRLMLTHQMQLTFQDDELQVVNQLQYGIERTGVFEIRYQVPDGLTIDDVSCPQMKEFNFDEDSRQLTVVLKEKTLGTLQVTIRSHQELAGDTAELNLPLIEPLAVERETGTIFVFARDAVEVITDQDGLEGVQPLPVDRARQGQAMLNSAWSYTRRPITIPVRTKKKPTRLSARVGTSIDVQPELTQVQTLLDYHVEYAGVDTFRFEVPEELSADIQIDVAAGDQQSAPIKQRTAEDPVDGWVTWTVITQRDVLGHQRLRVTYDLSKSSEEDATDTGSQTVQLIRPLGLVDDAGELTTPLTSVQGEVLVQKERSLSLNTTASGGEIEVIDLRELTILPQNGTIAYRYFQAEAENRPQLTISQSRFDIQEVVATVVTRGLVEVVAGEDAEATYRCRFHVKSTERQRLLVYLPVDLEVLGTYVNEREVKLEKADLLDSEAIGSSWTPFWVNVARPESSETPFLLAFQFLWKVNPTLGESTFGRGDMTLPLPVIGTNDSSVAQELKVIVWVPEDYALVGNPPGFDLATERRQRQTWWGARAAHSAGQLDRWVQQGLSSSIGPAQFPTEGRVPYVYTTLGGAKEIELRWWNDFSMSMIVSLAVALIGWVLMRTSWENKLGMVLFAAFAAALYGLNDSHALAEVLHAARFGIVLLIGLWIVHGFFGAVRCLQAAVSSRSSAPITEAKTVVEPPSENTSDPPEES